MTERPFARAAERNSKPILAVLAIEFESCSSILEIGSGTGQHAVCFGRALPHVNWQTSDMADNCDGIRAWVTHASLSNVLEPLVIDTRSAQSPGRDYDGVYSANTVHIMHTDAVAGMFGLVGDALLPGGTFALYGPFRQNGKYNTQSNESFDQSLKARDPGMGIRDIEWLDELAGNQGLDRVRLYAMPTNNCIAIWKKSGDKK